MLGLRNWNSDTWTAIAAVVAFIALVQPWLLGAWRRFFQRGTIDIYETATIEMGFSAFGPSVGLTGTLRARDRDMFVQSATLTVVKHDTRAPHNFEWILFRNPKTVIGPAAGPSAEVAVEAPYSFMILTTQPYRYNVAFCDAIVFQNVRSILEKFKQTFLTYVDQKTDINVQSLPADDNARNKLIRQLRLALNKFSETDDYKMARDSFTQFFYWEPGLYQLTLHVHSAQPHRIFSKTWSFSLLEADVENLMSNVPSVFEELVGLPLTTTYSFAYPRYISNPPGCLKLRLRAK